MHDEIVLKLFDIGAVKFGNFRLKSGADSPIYIDLREIISYPNLLKDVAESMWKLISACSFDRMCGVPYTALPIASYLSVEYNCPLVMRRKEVKNHGTGKLIEGVFQRGQRCLILEDLITSGISVSETIQPLEEVGLQVTDVVAFLDRQQGGRQKLEQQGCSLHTVFTLDELLGILVKCDRIDQKTRQSVAHMMLV